MKIAIVSMSKINEKFPRLEHCCEGLCENIVFHPEIHLFFSAMKKKGIDSEFLDGSLMNENKILEQLKEKKPKKIFYYVNTPYIRDKKEFMEQLSKISKLYLIAIPYFWREKILKEFPFVKDVYYDGERALKLNISNVKIDYEQIDLNPYLKKKDYAFPVLLSKYCPYQCTYCIAQNTGLVERDLSIVKQELYYLKKIGFKRFALLGNNLTLNKKRFIETCEIMRELDAEWSGEGRINHMDKDTYNALAGSRGTLLFGVESADQEILDKIKKNLTIEQIIKNAEELKKRNIPFRYTFMFGFPWDSKKTAKEMIELRKKVGALNYHCLFLSPLPGTPLFNEIKMMNLVNEKELNFDDFKNPYLFPICRTKFLSKEELKQEAKKIMIAGIFSKSVFLNILKGRKIREYPEILLKGIKVFIFGRRN